MKRQAASEANAGGEHVMQHNPLDAQQVARVGAIVDDVLDKPMSKRLVGVFYDPETNFAGNTFLGLPPNKADELGPADLLAVTTLGVNPGAAAIRALLPPEGRLCCRCLLKTGPDFDGRSSLVPDPSEKDLRLGDGP